MTNSPQMQWQKLLGLEDVTPEKIARYDFARDFIVNNNLGDKVLDFPGHKGYGSFILAKSAKEVVAVEANEIKNAVYYTYYNVNNIHFIKSDPLTVDLPGPFSCVVCTELLENTPELESVVKRLSVLSNNIIFSVSIDGDNSPPMIADQFRQYGYELQEYGLQFKDTQNVIYMAHAKRNIGNLIIPDKITNEIIVYLRDRNRDPVIDKAMEAVIAGLEAKNIPFTTATQSNYQPSKVAIVWSIFKRRIQSFDLASIYAQQHARGLKVLTLECGYIHRDRYFMVGWDGLNNRADFMNQACPSDRWQQLQVPLQPWRLDGKHIVVCGQVAWDASVQYSDHPKWCIDTIAKLKTLTDREIVFRPHPKHADIFNDRRAELNITTNANFSDDLRDAWAVVTYSSNAGVEAAIAGIPVFAADEGSMAWEIANHDISQINDPQMPDREQWAYNLAYSQWSLEEIAAGKVFDHILQESCP